jgi:hypothetical protein
MTSGYGAVLAIAHNAVVVTGAGLRATMIQTGTNGKHQVISVASKSQATFAQLEITRGGAGKTGGGDLTNSGMTTLDAVTVTANTAARGGGITNSSGATLSLINSMVSANKATSGPDSKPGGSAGGIENAGTLTLTGSTVTGNSAGSDGIGLNDTAGSGGNGGGIDNVGTVVATNSTIRSNFAGSGGPGVGEVPGQGGSGAGLLTTEHATISSSTFTGNTAGVGYFGPPGNGGAVANTGTLFLEDCRRHGWLALPETVHIYRDDFPHKPLPLPMALDELA